MSPQAGFPSELEAIFEKLSLFYNTFHHFEAVITYFPSKPAAIFEEIEAVFTQKLAALFINLSTFYYILHHFEAVITEFHSTTGGHHQLGYFLLNTLC